MEIPLLSQGGGHQKMARRRCFPSEPPLAGSASRSRCPPDSGGQYSLFQLIHTGSGSKLRFEFLNRLHSPKRGSNLERLLENRIRELGIALLPLAQPIHLPAVNMKVVDASFHSH